MEKISDELNEHCVFWHSDTLADEMETWSGDTPVQCLDLLQFSSAFLQALTLD